MKEKCLNNVYEEHKAFLWIDDDDDASLLVKNMTATLSSAGTISVDTISTTTMVPQTSSIEALPKTIPIPISDIVHRTIPINMIPPFEGKHEVRASEIIPEADPINTFVNTETIAKTVPIPNTSTYDAISGMKSIFDHSPNSHLQSAILDNKKPPNQISSLLRPNISSSTSTITISSSQTIGTIEAKLPERSFLMPYLQTAQKIYQQQDNDDLKVKPSNIQLKASSTSPVITYSQSAPKTRLDQWKRGMNQKQQQQQQLQQKLSNQDWIDNNNDNHNDHNNIVNNSNTILLLSSIIPIPSFLLLFLLRLLSL
ncbi:unnamed protein product [Cercopithifilaria johnstoni]|uniref:Uncharacterized protein n=1 Tax=Cercopithifilaria johnstoni TaxID=2874296 RepID=A0A8J2MHN2_9BILA|nr:unnamed protein product [Cercopithifilaria johnstoni]